MLPTVWRINIKTGAEAGVDPRRFCLSGQCLGVGWPVGDAECLDWDAYVEQAKLTYPKDNGWWPALNALRNRMRVDDLCWTRDLAGVYYLGRITGPWRYIGCPEHRQADVVNVRSCEWLTVGLVDKVPGKVVNSFGPNRTVQVVDDETVRIFSAYFYNTKTTSEFRYDLPVVLPDIFSLLSSEDCEDLVALYMQLAGYLLLASTCKRSTSAYEFVMRHRASGEHAVAQVKNGFDDLKVEDYHTFPGKVFLFTTRGRYIGDPPDNVVCLSGAEVRRFIQEHEHFLPERIKVWLGLVTQLADHRRAV